MKAPDFELPDADGKSVRLSRLKGRLVVVYFYPKDDTSGCTAEAKGFSCLIEAFKKAGGDVIGISPDGPASHRKFADKYDLSVHLLADEAKETAQAYLSALVRPHKNALWISMRYPNGRDASRGAMARFPQDVD